MAPQALNHYTEKLNNVKLVYRSNNKRQFTKAETRQKTDSLGRNRWVPLRVEAWLGLFFSPLQFFISFGHVLGRSQITEYSHASRALDLFTNHF